jgi:hypothetical protein
MQLGSRGVAREAQPGDEDADEDRPSDTDAVVRARDEALAAVLRRHGLLGKKFHNEAVVQAVAAEVASAVAAVLQRKG